MNVEGLRLRRVGSLVMLLGGLLGAGCGSATYRMEKEVNGPAAPVELRTSVGGVEMVVAGLVIYDGPGSWKQHAYWDEYLVRVENHRTDPVTLESINLGDILGRLVEPGSDPKVLDESGRNHEQYLRGLNAPVDAAKFSPPAPPPRPEDSLVTLGKTVVGLGVGATIYQALPFVFVMSSPVILAVGGPVWLTNKFLVDPKQRKLVLAEIDRRRLVLPCNVGPGAEVAGSLFYPLTPGPERMVLRGRCGPEPIALTVELPGMAGLHFSRWPDKAALQAAKSGSLPQPPPPPRSPPKDPGLSEP